MTHDEFLIALRDAPTWTGTGSDPRPALDAEAQAHARECPECARVLETLILAAREDAALLDAVPPGYWDDFGGRVLARLPRAGEARLPRAEQGSSRAMPWLRLAAGLLVGALALMAWRFTRPQPGRGSAVEIASPPEFLATMPPEDVEDALASFSVSGVDARATEDGAADDAMATEPIAADDSLFSEFLEDADGPVERLESELLENLTESDQRELARRLQEASS